MVFSLFDCAPSQITIYGYGLYIGLRFEVSDPHSRITADNVAEAFTAQDGKTLFSMPLPITPDARR